MTDTFTVVYVERDEIGEEEKQFDDFREATKFYLELLETGGYCWANLDRNGKVIRKYENHDKEFVKECTLYY